MVLQNPSSIPSRLPTRACQVIVKGRLEGALGPEHHQFPRERTSSGALPIPHLKWTAGSVVRVR